MKTQILTRPKLATVRCITILTQIYTHRSKRQQKTWGEARLKAMDLMSWSARASRMVVARHVPAPTLLAVIDCMVLCSCSTTAASPEARAERLSAVTTCRETHQGTRFNKIPRCPSTSHQHAQPVSIDNHHTLDTSRVQVHDIL